MKKIIGALITMAVIAAASSVVACATTTEENTNLPEAGTTENNTTNSEETITGDVTTVAETSAEGNKTTVPSSGEETEIGGDADNESTTLVIIEDEETIEDDSDSIKNESVESPPTGANGRVFPVVATLLMSGVALAYCVIKGKKHKKTK